MSYSPKIVTDETLYCWHIALFDWRGRNASIPSCTVPPTVFGKSLDAIAAIYGLEVGDGNWGPSDGVMMFQVRRGIAYEAEAGA